MTNVDFVNLTPHDITIVHDDGNTTVLPRSENPARVEVTRRQVGSLNGAPVYQSVFGNCDLPLPKQFTVFVVSRVVAERHRERDDLVIPDETVRDADGRIIGCKSFAVV